jgi:transglutaminase-like putative cysteine protease
MYCSSDSDITNILRSDNGEPLFKMTKVGEKAPPHAWVEIRTSSGKWIPVDPTTNLVGDTQEGVDMFKKANYMAEVYGLKKEVNPPNSFSYVLHGSFLPDQNTALMRLTTIVKKTISLREEDKYSPYKGDVEVTISNDLTDPMSNSTIKTV